MKISEIKVYVLETNLNEKQAFTWSQNHVESRVTTIVEIKTENGLTGVGEAFGFAPRAVKAMIDHYYTPRIIGENALDTNRIWDMLYSSTRMEGQKGVPIQALSAIDIALWDLKGKFFETPIANLLGGFYRHQVNTYPTGLYRKRVKDQTKALVDEALGYIEDGYSAMKLKIGFGLHDDLEKIAAIRKAIGSEAKLMLDVNCAYNAVDALWLATRVEDFDIYWYEEPLPPDDIKGYEYLKKKIRIPIAAGESEFTRYGFRELITNRIVDIIQPSLCSTGGFSELQKIVSMAATYNLRCVPHVWGSAVGLAAALQLMAAMPHFPTSLYPEETMMEYDRSPNPLRDDLVEEEIEMEGTRMRIPNQPGLGITINKEILDRYKVE